MSRFGILSLLIVGIVFLAIPSFGFQTEYFLYTSTGEEYTLPVLKILPTGQIVTTGLLYPADQTPSFGLLSDRRILLVANPSVSYQGFASYKINADYSLTLLSASTSTTHAFYINLTPNEQLLLKSQTYFGEIWSIDSLGHVTNTGNTFSPHYFTNPVRPQGDIAIAVPGATAGNLTIYQINYGTQSLVTSQVIPYNHIQKIIYTPDGNLAIGIGHDLGGTFSPSQEVALFSISSSGSVSTTTSMLGFNLYPFEAAITPDGKYFFFEAAASPRPIVTLQVNSVTTTIQDTGKRYSHPTTSNGFVSVNPAGALRVTPDGKMLVYMYENSVDSLFWLATAWINDDGSLTWTGYDFPYDAYFTSGLDSINDMVIVPNYITSIPDELWKGFE